MTPRKELFVKIKNQLKTITALEMVDLHRKQFESEKFPNLLVAALIRINRITWVTMTEQNQEGTATVDIIFYCRDGWNEQHAGTNDLNEGLTEMDILDEIAEKLQFLSGEQFTWLEQIEDETEEQGMAGIFSYRQSFSTNIYRKLAPKYQNKTVKLTPNGILT